MPETLSFDYHLDDLFKNGCAGLGHMEWDANALLFDPPFPRKI